MAPADPREPDGGARASPSGRLGGQPPLWWSLLYFFSLLMRLLRAASGARRDGRPPAMRSPCSRGVGGLGARARGWDIARLHAAGAVHRHVPRDARAAALVRRARRALSAARVPAGGVPGLHRVPARCSTWRSTATWPGRGVAFFVWTAVFNLFAVSVFWSFMADVFDDAHAKRVYGYIGAGGTVGALLGPAHHARAGAAHRAWRTCCWCRPGSSCVCLLCILQAAAVGDPRANRARRGSGEHAMGGSIWAGLRLVVAANRCCARWRC